MTEQQEYELRCTVRRFVRHFGLPPHLAQKMAERKDLADLLDRIETFRHNEGQCLPPSCALVVGFIKGELLYISLPYRPT